MTVCTVYGDLLFFTDFLMDLCLLFAVSRFGNFKTPRVLFFVSAALGGAYSLFSVLPSFFLLRTWYMKLLFSCCLVKTAFPYLKGKRFLTAFVYFYLIGFAMAGAVICLSWFFREHGWSEAPFSYTAMGLSAAMLFALFLSRFGSGYIRKTLRVNETTETVTIALDGKTVRLAALFDTGNELTDPVTRLPVMIVEYDAVKSLLPESFRETLRRCADLGADRVFSALQTEPLGPRLRLIPFSSIGRENGMMLGLRVDTVGFPARKKKESKDVVICFYRGSMRTKEHCKCIVNPTVLDLI